jgi:hypothetical protein
MKKIMKKLIVFLVLYFYFITNVNAGVRVNHLAAQSMFFKSPENARMLQEILPLEISTETIWELEEDITRPKNKAVRSKKQQLELDLHDEIRPRKIEASFRKQDWSSAEGEFVYDFLGLEDFGVEKLERSERIVEISTENIWELEEDITRPKNKTVRSKKQQELVVQDKRNLRTMYRDRPFLFEVRSVPFIFLPNHSRRLVALMDSIKLYKKKHSIEEILRFLGEMDSDDRRVFVLKMIEQLVLAEHVVFDPLKVDYMESLYVYNNNEIIKLFDSLVGDDGRVKFIKYYCGQYSISLKQLMEMYNSIETEVAKVEVIKYLFQEDVFFAFIYEMYSKLEQVERKLEVREMYKEKDFFDYYQVKNLLKYYGYGFVFRVFLWDVNVLLFFISDDKNLWSNKRKVLLKVLKKAWISDSWKVSSIICLFKLVHSEYQGKPNENFFMDASNLAECLKLIKNNDKKIELCEDLIEMREDITIDSFSKILDKDLFSAVQVRTAA